MIKCKNESGNASIFLLFILAVVGLLCAIILNIGKAYVTKEQAELNAEQAAFSATGVIVDATKEAIEQFESSEEGRIIFPPLNGNKRLSQLIEEKQDEFKDNHYYEHEAYILALNTVITNDKLTLFPSLKSKLEDEINGSFAEIKSTIYNKVSLNKGETNETRFVHINSDNRIEVEVPVEFEAASDGDYIPAMTEKVKQVGSGPTLDYLEFLNISFKDSIQPLI
jgi:hypothetical protein